MAGKSSRSSKASQKAMGIEFFAALEQFEQERGIPMDYMIEKITAAITAAMKGSDVEVNADKEKQSFDVYTKKTVVEEVADPNREMLIEEAHLIDKKAVLGDVVKIRLDTHEIGRIAATTAKHVIRQGIHEMEHGRAAAEMQSHDQELVTAVIDHIDDRSGTAYVMIGKNQIALPKNEQIEGEELHDGDSVKVYVVNANSAGERGGRVTVSRTHPGLVKRMFETEVPEIYDGTVEIKAVAREAGSRTKLAVISHDENVDPVGACIGVNRCRVRSIVEELNGEKIDIIKWSEDPTEFISNALSPAKVVSVEMDEENSRVCRVRVPDSQLSLAIGHKGQNARLAARLTGCKIDIRPESGYYGEDEEE